MMVSLKILTNMGSYNSFLFKTAHAKWMKTSLVTSCFEYIVFLS